MSDLVIFLMGFMVAFALCALVHLAATERPNKKAEGDAREPYRADFLWPYEDGTPECHGYEFANAKTEEYRKVQWEALKEAIQQAALAKADRS